MKVYVSEYNEKEKLLDSFEIAKNIEEADSVIITPGGLSSLSDMFEAIVRNKNLYLYNEEQYYNKIIEQLYKMYEKGYEKNEPFKYMKIESEFQSIIDDLNNLKNSNQRHI